MNDFGVIVTCARNDYLFAKGCCASVRYFMPDVPLCLLVDGKFSLGGLPEAYGASVISKATVRSKFLRERSFGYGITKMVAFWESPFKYFLLLDADTCVWGDLREHALYDRYDFIVDQPCYPYSPEAIRQYFFDVEFMKQFSPTFACLSHPYVCTGVILGQRDVLRLEGYEEILNVAENNPKVFYPGEMGFLNYMLFKSAEEGKLRLGARDIQYIVLDFTPEDMRRRFPMEQGKPVCMGASTTIHWCGNAKPVVANREGFYTDPMTFFRRRFLEDSAGTASEQTEQVLRREERRRERRLNRARYKRDVRRWLARLRNKAKKYVRGFQEAQGHA